MQGARLGIGHGIEIPQGGGIGRFGVTNGDLHLRLLLENFIMQYQKGPVIPLPRLFAQTIRQLSSWVSAASRTK
ncbi:hypothetical protein VAWG005_38660 [Aeromonas dhakensis]|nr:hypothetical protein VAWG003_38640 [Aeromonas dhakensis]BEE27938.1 hypothetical protein VAWG005_38660 [Aeromonas dhakensis]